MDGESGDAIVTVCIVLIIGTVGDCILADACGAEGELVAMFAGKTEWRVGVAIFTVVRTRLGGH